MLVFSNMGGRHFLATKFGFFRPTFSNEATVILEEMVLEIVGVLAIQVALMSLLSGIRSGLRCVTGVVGLLFAMPIVSKPLFLALCIVVALGLIMTNAPKVQYANKTD